MNIQIDIKLLCAWSFLAIVAICITGCVQQSNTNRPESITTDDVIQLGSDPTIEDVRQLLKEIPPTQLPWFEYAANDGGIFIFVFIPTNEVNLDSQTSSANISLVAVVKSNSREAFMRAEGHYVLPNNVAGQSFTGFPLPTTKDAE